MFGWLKCRRAAPPTAPQPFGHLQPGRRYRIARAFIDHDGITHPASETWTFVRSTFLPYEDGLSLFVVTPEGSEEQIRLQRRPETQGPIIDALHEYMLLVSDTAGG